MICPAENGASSGAGGRMYSCPQALHNAGKSPSPSVKMAFFAQLGHQTDSMRHDLRQQLSFPKIIGKLHFRFRYASTTLIHYSFDLFDELFVQVGIFTACRHQFAVGTTLDNPPLIDDQDAIGI